MPGYFDTRLLQENAERARREANKAEAEKLRENLYAAMDRLKVDNSEAARKAAEDIQTNLMKISEEDRNAWYGNGNKGLDSWVAAFPRKPEQTKTEELGFGDRLKAAFTSFAATTVGNVGYADQKWNEAWTGKPANIPAAPEQKTVAEQPKPQVKDEQAAQLEAAEKQTYDNILNLAKTGKVIKQGHSENQKSVEADEALSIQMALVSAGAIDVATEPYNFKNGVQKNAETGAIKIAANDFGYMQKGGGLTAEALKVHQQRIGLKPTGEADAQTVASLAVYQNPQNKGLSAEALQQQAKEVAEAVGKGADVEAALVAANTKSKAAADKEVGQQPEPARKEESAEAKTEKPANQASLGISGEALAAAAKVGGRLSSNGSAVTGNYSGDSVAYTSGTAIQPSKELELA